MIEKKVTKTEVKPSSEQESKQSGPKVSSETSQERAPRAACHHHSWLGKHFCVRNFKRFGALGVVILVLHILFHVVELLLIPAILMWLGHK